MSATISGALPPPYRRMSISPWTSRTGYRHFSFLTYVAVLYLAVLRGVRVRGVYYGLLRPPGPPATRDEPASESSPPLLMPSPFLDLRPLLELPRWLHALETLRETGSTASIAQLLDRGPSTQLTTKLSRGLSELSEGYLSGLPIELGRQARDLGDEHFVRNLRRLLERDHQLPLAGELVDQLVDIVKPFSLPTPMSGDGWKRRVALSQDELRRQARIIDELLRHGSVATALGLMSEWTVSWVVWRYGEADEWLDFSARRRAANVLDAVAAVGSDSTVHLVEALTHEQRKLGVFWSQLRELRNAYAHHGMRPQVVAGDKKIAKRFERIRHYWTATLRSCPDFPLALGAAPNGRVLVSPIGKRPGVLFSAIQACRTGRQSGDPVRCVVICSRETEEFAAEAAKRAGYAGAVEPLRLEDPFGGRGEIERLAGAARRYFVGAEEVVVNVTGGTTLMGLAAEALANAARRLACPVRRFGLIDRRPPDQQEADPYRTGEAFWIDTPETGDVGEH